MRLTELQILPAFFPLLHHCSSLYCQLLQPVFHLHHSFNKYVNATNILRELFIHLHTKLKSATRITQKPKTKHEILLAVSIYIKC